MPPQAPDHRLMQLASIAPPAGGKYRHPTFAADPSASLKGGREVAAAAAAALEGRQLYLRIREAVILDDFDGWFAGNMEIKLVGMVIDSNAENPIHFSTPVPFPGIKPRVPLPIAGSGIGVYYTSPSKLPAYLDFRLLVIEDDQDVRDVGAIIERMRADPNYKVILDAAKAAATAANPAYGTLIAIGDALVGLVGTFLKQNEDDLISYFQETHTLAFDNLGIGAHTFYQEGRSRVRYEILAA